MLDSLFTWITHH